LSLVQIDWNPDAGKLRSFGAVLLCGFGLLGAAFFFGWPFPPNRTVALVLWIGGGALGLLGLSGTGAARPVYWAWMSLAFLTGNVVSRVVLALFYYLMITPMGLVQRLLGRDRLDLRGSGRDSYWTDVDHKTNPESYERQF
jgi:hypothetical protein